ncbi:O-methyltransferase [Cytobacillus spongiae]|uniref:O-methyltransferase n=1 Tax=Cytobacillus spongiae TaxID=2901381 RepID=UPI001F3381E9|nr:O-methyltransferase [Cytobacillus spongiae]UII54973.1 O-methyltransferase [Cytobacillus spongiae]
MLDQQLIAYIENLIPGRGELFNDMEAYAKEHNVPIMELVGMETLLQLLRIHQPKKILEVGTAIGYSALRMATALPDAHIVTIERDEERANKALFFIQQAEKSSQITLVQGDALEVEDHINPLGLYDVIFIDAAKGQYKRFFELYENYLSPGGLIITDNILYKGLVVAKEFKNRRQRSLLKKINEYNAWLLSHPNYDSVILPVGDGIVISKKR